MKVCNKATKFYKMNAEIILQYDGQTKAVVSDITYCGQVIIFEKQGPDKEKPLPSGVSHASYFRQIADIVEAIRRLEGPDRTFSQQEISDIISGDHAEYGILTMGDDYVPFSK
jgi:hypothetical protein